MDEKFLLSLGVQDKPVGLLNYGAPKSQKYRYRKGVLLSLDWKTNEQEVLFEYESPKENAPVEGSSIGFKFLSMTDQFLYLCTETEVLIVDHLNGHEMKKVISLKEFNDVHHVLPVNNYLYVVSTGLDAVFKLDLDGNIVDEWSTLEGHGIWERFNKEYDYRSRSTKPHMSHPNYLFVNDDKMWVTRFKQKDAVCLSDFDKRIDLSSVGNPHDGIVQGDQIYFTTTNGHIIVVDKNTYEVLEKINLNEVRNLNSPMGWARGIAVNGRYAYIGFTKLRETKFRENLKWVNSGFEKQTNMTTRVEKYDIIDKTFIDYREVKIDSGSALFSVHPL